MDATPEHLLTPDVSFDGGNLDCGGGLLLLIRRTIDPLPPGGLLEILSTESTVEGELPAWCRMTGNELVSWTRTGPHWSFLVSKGPLAARASETAGAGVAAFSRQPAHDVSIPTSLPVPQPAPAIAPLSVMGIGSWPRPAWMLLAIHDRLERRMTAEEFSATADDAVRLSTQAQMRAGIDVLTDGEQRRDNYVSFVGGLLDNCQLIPLTDLSAMVDDSEEFERELKSLDVPAAEVRHPVVYGKLGRSLPLALHELQFMQQLATGAPVKIALPGPYLLTRTMWLDCLTDRPYKTREELADDVVRVLREEVHHLLAAGAALVQFDEPVLTEVVHGEARAKRSFMCGALSERYDTATELEFARELLTAATRGLPRDRFGLHICRGNWTSDESAALSGDYAPLMDMMTRADVGTLFLELSTDRAGDMDVLAGLPDDKRIGVGLVNPKTPRIENSEAIQQRIHKAIDLFGRERVLLNPDCGFATFADNPVASATIAEAKLKAIVEARNHVTEKRARS